MAKAFRALKRVTHSGKTYEIGDSIPGLKAAEAKRLQELGAIEGAAADPEPREPAESSKSGQGSTTETEPSPEIAELAEQGMDKLKEFADELGLDYSPVGMSKVKLAELILAAREEESESGGQQEALPGVNPQLGGD